jgi:hypothetical protein
MERERSQNTSFYDSDSPLQSSDDDDAPLQPNDGRAEGGDGGSLGGGGMDEEGVIY